MIFDSVFTAVRQRFAERKGGGGQLRSRVSLPAAVEPSLHMLRGLRAFHPDLDVYHLPDGQIWLLRRQEHAESIATGRATLHSAKKEEFTDPLYGASLMAEGWKLWGVYDYGRGTSVGAMVGEAQRKMHAGRHELEAAMRALRAESDNTNKMLHMTKVLSDRIRSSSRGDWGRTYRGRKVFARSR